MRNWVYQAYITSSLPPEIVLIRAKENMKGAILLTWRPVGELRIDCRPGDDMLSTKYTITQDLELVPVSPS